MIFSFSVKYWDDGNMVEKLDSGYVQGKNFNSAYRRVSEYYDLDLEAISVSITVPADLDEEGKFLICETINTVDND